MTSAEQWAEVEARDIIIKSLVAYVKTLEDVNAELERESTSIFAQPVKRADHPGVWIDGVNAEITLSWSNNVPYFKIVEKNNALGPIGSSSNFDLALGEFRDSIVKHYGS